MSLTNEDLKAIAQLLDDRIGPVKEDVSLLKEDVAGLKEDVSVLKEDVSVLKEDVSFLKDKVTAHDRRVDKLESRVENIELTLENETNRNIRFIAEGHLDIIRKLDEARKIEQEKEMFSIILTSLENDVRILKQKCL